MKKLSLAVIGMYIGMAASFSQTIPDSSLYKNKKLKLEEINFVTGYYHQEGDHSPVTGGTGTEKLSDIATTIELKLFRNDKQNRRHDLNFEMGIDHYTSASSDKIDPHTISSASGHDERYYPSASYTITNEVKGAAATVYASYSAEADYNSRGLGVGFTKTSKDKNREINIKLQSYFDRVRLVLPVELRQGPYQKNRDVARSPRNSFSSSLIFSQIINKKLQLALLIDVIYQSGYLGTPFHRIYFTNGNVSNEKLPSSRFKIPAAIRLNYFAGDKFIIRSYYRYYRDDWGLTANTFNLEMPVKLSPFISLNPFYRCYSQNGVRYFAPYMSHSVTEEFYTTDDDLSKFTSNFFGAGVRFTPAGNVFGIKHLSNAELRLGHYNRSDGLNSNILTLALKFK